MNEFIKELNNSSNKINLDIGEEKVGLVHRLYVFDNSDDTPKFVLDIQAETIRSTAGETETHYAVNKHNNDAYEPSPDKKLQAKPKDRDARNKALEEFLKRFTYKVAEAVGDYSTLETIKNSIKADSTEANQPKQ